MEEGKNSGIATEFQSEFAKLTLVSCVGCYNQKYSCFNKGDYVFRYENNTCSLEEVWKIQKKKCGEQSYLVRQLLLKLIVILSSF